MGEVILKVENLSKQYRLGTVGTGTISHDLNRWWHAIRGKEDPYLKIGESNDRSTKGESEYVWALKDINFEVKRGEVLGIIGKNGAGKSTLLKILSKVTGPTTGSIKSNGRIASLLEVGTGFHPEMTGRENVYLNGAILGMTKKEIAGKIDEIIAFSGCERYIDTPVKRYSSGMKVRLAFAVAAHLEPDILIVDEVLAVGDAEFQKKAIGKMKAISTEGGRTVLFVSHNMAAVKSLCSNTVVLNNGQISFRGTVKDGIDYYLQQGLNLLKTTDLINRTDRTNASNFKFTDIKIKDEKGAVLQELISGLKCSFDIAYTSNLSFNLKGIRMMLVDEKGVIRVLSNTGLVESNNITIKATSNGKVSFVFEKFPLPKGNYYVSLSCFSSNGVEDDIEQTCKIKVSEGDFYNTGRVATVTEGVLVDFKVNISQ